MKKHINILFVAAAVLGSAVSCNRFLDITPTGIVAPVTLQDYRDLMATAYNNYPTHKPKLHLRTDEVKINATSSAAPQVNDLYIWKDNNPDITSDQVPYESFYKAVMYANQVIKGVSVLPDSSEQRQLLGEAYAFRALVYFELANIYAPVYSAENLSKPAIVITTDTKLEGAFPKSNLEEVYTQIEGDLTKAKTLLNVEKQNAGFNYRFTTVAADALAARISLYKGDYQKTVENCNKVLAKNSNLENFNSFTNLPQSFKSVESIMNLDLAVDYSLSSAMFASDNLLALYDKTNDLRFAKYFTKSGNNYKTAKYKSNNETKWTFRVSDILLLKAEALSRLNSDTEAKNTIIELAAKRYNATGLAAFKTKIAALSGSALLGEILEERQRETAFDGLRWYDLRRTTQPEIKHSASGQEHILQKNDPRYTLPFPAEARKRNPLL